MNLDDNWRKKWDPCKEAWDWLEAQEDRDAEKVIRKLIDEKRYDWAFWALSRCMSRENAVKLAIFSARLVLPIFEKEFPSDDRPRRAIEAAERDNLNHTSAYSAYSAADTAYSAAAAAYSAAEKEKMVMKITEFGFELMGNEK